MKKNPAGVLTSLVAEGKHQTTTVNFKSLVLAAGGNLKETFDHYQEYAKAGRDPEFGSDAKSLHELEGDTYYVIEQKLRFCTTMGGYEATKDM